MLGVDQHGHRREGQAGAGGGVAGPVFEGGAVEGERVGDEADSFGVVAGDDGINENELVGPRGGRGRRVVNRGARAPCAKIQGQRGRVARVEIHEGQRFRGLDREQNPIAGARVAMVAAGGHAGIDQRRGQRVDDEAVVYASRGERNGDGFVVLRRDLDGLNLNSPLSQLGQFARRQRGAPASAARGDIDEVGEAGPVGVDEGQPDAVAGAETMTLALDGERAVRGMECCEVGGVEAQVAPRFDAADGENRGRRNRLGGVEEGMCGRGRGISGRIGLNHFDPDRLVAPTELSKLLRGEHAGPAPAADGGALAQRLPGVLEDEAHPRPVFAAAAQHDLALALAEADPVVRGDRVDEHASRRFQVDFELARARRRGVSARIAGVFAAIVLGRHEARRSIAEQARFVLAEGQGPASVGIDFQRG